MELTLTRASESRLTVLCDGQPSHTCELLSLIPNESRHIPHPLTDPALYGQALYDALFPPGSPARHLLANEPERILLVTEENDLDAIPWEYTHTGEDFLVLEHHFVRGLPEGKRIAPPKLDSGLHIVAIPSHPLSHHLEALNIEGEWTRLEEIIKELPYAITLERCRPPTLDRLGLQVANQQNRIIHFMGHGGQDEQEGAVLCFERENGSLDLVKAKDFTRQIKGTTFLVTLNACASATPGDTHLSNLAAALVKQKTPYALGMRFSIPDDDALTFSRTFYSYLARGSSVEEAVYRVRLALARSKRPWMVGMPVLYTALATPAPGISTIEGAPTIQDRQPEREVSALPIAQGAFQGRIEELQQLGTWLTGDNRPRIITIHGGGGQGKTALAREAVERFSHGWPGGVWAISLENLPERPVFLNTLARFLRIPVQDINDPAEVERRVLASLSQRRFLLALDNAETLVDAVEAKNEAAINLAQYIQQLPGRTVSLLITSRVSLGWAGEVSLELSGLSPEEGAALFRQHAPQRVGEIDMAVAQQLSRKVHGHPLSLQLLGGAFNASPIALPAFFREYEERLVKAENKYVGPEHRHRTLYASIETSVRYLDDEHRQLLSKLWLFHAPFMPAWARSIFDPLSEGEEANNENDDSPVYEQLYTLWQRGLLVRERPTLREGTLWLFHMLPTIRPYIERYLARAEEREILLARFGRAYLRLVFHLTGDLDIGSIAAYLASLCQEDFERATFYVSGIEKGYYLLGWGQILQHLGERRHAIKLLEQALEIGQDQDEQLKLAAMNNIAIVYQATSQPFEALKLSQAILPILRETGDRAGEASTLCNIANVYQTIGQTHEALHYYQEALSITKKIGDDHVGEASALNGMAAVYQTLGQIHEALHCYQEALSIMKKIGNRTGEAATLNGMAIVYRDTGQPFEALKLFQAALPIMREVGDRAREATLLNGMAILYRETGQPFEALKLFQAALPITKEVGDRVGEATVLNGIARVYQAIGQPFEALKLFQQVLPIRREVSDRAGEATTLNSMGMVYQAIDQYSEALKLFQQVLSITREVSNRADEAATLNNMAAVYQDLGQPSEALKLLQAALPIQREIGNRAGEGVVLYSMAMVYQTLGQPLEALQLLQAALPIRREVDDHAGEATTLTSMGMVYQAIGQYSEALQLLQAALPIRQEVGDRAGEATTLNNIAEVYRMTGQFPEALKLYQAALSIMKEVGNPAGEATTLSNMALIYQATNQFPEALKLYQAALSIMKEVGNPAGEATTLNGLAHLYQSMQHYTEAQSAFEQSLSLSQTISYPTVEVASLIGLALLFYQHLQRQQEAIFKIEQAIAVLQKTGLPRGASGSTLEDLQDLLEMMRSGTPISINNPPLMSAEYIRRIVSNTIAVMTVAQDRQSEWRERVSMTLQSAQRHGDTNQIKMELLSAVLAILDGRSSGLPPHHPYARVIADIQAGIASGGAQVAKVSEEVTQALLDFVNAHDLVDIRRMMEEQKDLLFRPEAEALLEQLIAHAQADGEEQIGNLLELQLTLLRHCKQDGIAEAFKRLEQAMENGDAR